MTEQRRARLALATEHERTVLMIESMNAAVSVVHLEENNNELLYANALYCKYWGQNVEGHIRIRDLFNQASAVGHTAEIHDKKTSLAVGDTQRAALAGQRRFGNARRHGYHRP